MPSQTSFVIIHMLSNSCTLITTTVSNHFDDCFIPNSSIRFYSTNNCSPGKCSLTFVGPKEWSSIPDCRLRSVLPVWPSYGKLRNTSYM